MRAPASGDPSGASSAEISGNLKSLAFGDVIQFLQAAGKSGILMLQNPSKTGEVHFRGGEVEHASCADLEGERAFYQIALWTEGSFSFSKSPGTAPRSIQLPTMTLLMEAMRLADEAQKERGRLP